MASSSSAACFPASTEAANPLHLMVAAVEQVDDRPEHIDPYSCEALANAARRAAAENAAAEERQSRRLRRHIWRLRKLEILKARLRKKKAALKAAKRLEKAKVTAVQKRAARGAAAKAGHARKRRSAN